MNLIKSTWFVISLNVLVLIVACICGSVIAALIACLGLVLGFTSLTMTSKKK